MAYDATKPTDDEYLSAFPAEMREQLRAIIHDAIVNALTVNGYSPGNLNGNIPVSNGNLNANLNADKLDGHDATYFSASGHVHDAATPSTNGFMSNTDKTKVDGIATGAEVNQNAFSNVAVGSTTIQADSKTDTLTFEAGANIAITPDATNDKVNIAVTGIADTYFPKSGGTISGDITAKEVYANGWFRTTGDTGWYSDTYGGGWYMKDDTWIRAANNKGVFTGGKMQADSGFQGNLNGISDYANALRTINADGARHNSSFNWIGKDGQPSWLWGGNDPNNMYVYDPAHFDVWSASLLRPLSGDANCKLAYTADGQRANAGEWGRVVMRFDPNGQTYGVRCDRADLADNATHAGTADNASALSGYTAAQLLATSQKTSASLGGNGWWKDSNTGLIIQWGNAGALSNSGTTVVFSTAFPTACVRVFLIATGTMALNEYGAYIYSKAAASFVGCVRTLDGRSTPVNFEYIAIGY